MDKPLLTFGESELEIMKAVWKAKASLSASQIGEMGKEKGWKRTTVATFLARLVEKGALKSEKIGKALHYTALISAKEYRRAQVKMLLKNVFDGSAQALIASLFEEKSLTDKELQELQAILKDKEG